MPKTTLTFEIGGCVEVNDFAAGIDAFQKLIRSLTPKGLKVAWVVEDLQPGSAIATFRGESDSTTHVEQIVERYENVGSALSRSEGIYSHDYLPYSDQTRKAALGIIRLTSSVEYVRFGTQDSDYIIYGNGDDFTEPALSVSVGTVTGRVQTLTNRSGLKFNLYDSMFDKAVACYLRQGQEELMREVWDRRVEVSGSISRQTRTGRPISIRNILSVIPTQEAETGSYYNARGAVPWQPGQRLPEEVVRELRDAW